MPSLGFWLSVVVIVSASCRSGPSPRDGLLLPFWLADGAAAGPNIVEVYDHHACSGRVALARVDRIPPIGSKPLEPEAVLELDSSGTIIARWPIPIDRVVVGVDGRAILLSNPPYDTALSVLPDGSISVGAKPTAMPEPVLRPCPNFAELRGSAYLRCFTFLDMRSHAPRSVAYEGPCT